MTASFTEVKICGITRLTDALCAAACGADAVGFIFHEASPRYIPPEKARAIIAALPRRIAKVGVFVNRPAPEVERIAESCGLDLIQLHGDESPAECRHFPADRIIKAVSPKPGEASLPLEAYRVRAFLVDAREPNRYGGTGKTADWEFAARLAKVGPLVLAGGLGPEKLEAALAVVAPPAVDINSGCETAPGIKDHRLMEAVVALVRRAKPAGSAGEFRGRTPSHGKIFCSCLGPFNKRKTADDGSGCLENKRGES